MEFTPYQGFSSIFFPFHGQHNYMSPFIALRLPGISSNLAVGKLVILLSSKIHFSKHYLSQDSPVVWWQAQVATKQKRTALLSQYPLFPSTFSLSDQSESANIFPPSFVHFMILLCYPNVYTHRPLVYLYPSFPSIISCSTENLDIIFTFFSWSVGSSSSQPGKLFSQQFTSNVVLLHFLFLPCEEEKSTKTHTFHPTFPRFTRLHSDDFIFSNARTNTHNCTKCSNKSLKILFTMLFPITQAAPYWKHHCQKHNAFAVSNILIYNKSYQFLCFYKR